MSDQVRGDDAARHAPQPEDAKAKTASAKPEKQDAPNYDRRVDHGLAEPVETMNSANDE